MIRPLNHWSLHRTIPTFDDTESLTVLELVGNVVTKINELIKEHNEFVLKIEKEVLDFKISTNKDIEEFKCHINTVMKEYIDSIDLKISLQNNEIAKAVDYMKTNLEATCEQLLIDGINSGLIGAELVETYDDANEELIIREVRLKMNETEGTN